MDRKRFEKLLPDYIENNLAGEDLAAFKGWMAAHPEARDEIRAMRRLILEVSDIEIPDPGDSFWDRFLPDLRTRMDRQTESTSLAEHLRRVVLRPAIIGSLALATVILALLAVYSNMGPRGEAVMEARRVRSRLEAALRGAEDDTLARMETYFEQQDPAEVPGVPLLAGSRTLSAAGSGPDSDWVGTWLEQEERRLIAEDGVQTYHLIGQLDDEEATRLEAMLRAEMTSG